MLTPGKKIIFILFLLKLDRRENQLWTTRLPGIPGHLANEA